MNKSFLISVFLQLFFVFSLSEYTFDFVFNRFKQFFSSKLKFVTPPGKNELKIICAEKIYANDLIFSIPFEKIIKTTNSYAHQAEITNILKSFHVDENLGDTVSLVIYALMKKFYEKSDGMDENQVFIKEYLHSLEAERDTLLWWDPKDFEYVKKSLYYFNDIWVENMVKETDSAIALTKEVLKDLEKKYVKFCFCHFFL